MAKKTRKRKTERETASAETAPIVPKPRTAAQAAVAAEAPESAEAAPPAAPSAPAPPRSASGAAPAPGFPFMTPPRDLVNAYLLLLLRNWSMHGYQLMQQLMQFGYQPTDPGSIYRQLRHLEQQGFIRSSWETGEAGPARRTYTLTDAGDAFLQSWATAIENYQKTLKFWSDLYSGIVSPRPPSKP